MSPNLNYYAWIWSPHHTLLFILWALSGLHHVQNQTVHIPHSLLFHGHILKVVKLSDTMLNLHRGVRVSVLND